mmetsp:Transcript_131957/g.312771  ORF Transcript_131957/g.312771 Transcript_131957/m.312771 type:complete len:274 (-) Transcript_131957:11-832(-)|eukprot:CAMPEP_0181463936 /NCGR_PEP_ID=MMETSP1110-20121109/35172_1 /TAXON_ID=174948 /ORGANISM="Symbiodinium sp., Strain CCMP421" /LENGTH=273 /DNA_ID=CAMNT_0023588651 /DNA_START=102 /DNA_END=923 /DNA_ORIENTATION=-
MMPMLNPMLLVLVWTGSCASSEISATSKTTALIQTGHVVPMHTKFVDSGHFEGEELESLLLTETGTGPDGEVEQCSQDCELTFEGETIADAGEKSVPCELRNLVETFLDVPALVVAFLAAFLASVQLRSMRSEDKAPTSVPEAASASDLIVDEFGCTALHRAADEGSVTEVERLLKGGLDVEAKEAWEETPLHIAARKGHADCVARFLAAGANSEALDLDDRTPLVLAAEAKQEEACRVLLDHGAGVAGLSDEDLPPTLNKLFLERLLVQEMH